MRIGKIARPSGPKTRCNGQWTEAKFNSFIKSLLRQGSRRWAPIQSVKQKAKRQRGHYECNSCKEIVGLTYREGRVRKQNIFVDHIEAIIDPAVGFTTWDECIQRMFCEEDNLQLLCKSCHDTKSQEEKDIAKQRRANEH